MPLQYAIAGIATSGNSASGYATARQLAYSAGLVTFTINGTDRTRFVSRYESEINDQQNETPNTATLMVRGFIPTVGQTVTITRSLDNALLFSGVVTDFEQVQRRTGTRFRYRLACTDWTFLFDRRRVTYAYGTQAANTSVSDLVQRFTSGFSTNNVQSGLSSVDFTAKMESPSQALTRMANLVGAFWYVDYDKDVHFRTTENLTNPTSLTTSVRFKRLKYTKTIGQIRTRVFVEGLTTQVSTETAAASTSLAVNDASNFSSSGGSAITGAQVLTYTGRNYGADLPDPTATPTAVENVGSAGFGFTTGSTYYFRMSWLSAAGETNMGPISAGATIANGTHGIDVSLEVPADQAFIGRRLWMAVNQNTSWALAWTTTDTTTATILIGFGSFIAATAPSTTTAGKAVPRITTTNALRGQGANTLAVTLLQNFTSGGGVAKVTSADKGTVQYVTYTGRSGSSGSGTLTGVPNTGPGSILVAIASGADIVDLQLLTGIPASGTGAIVTRIAANDNVSLLAVRNDVSAQTALAALEGGDGIHEHYIQDRRLSLAGANARGDAELTLGKDPDELATYTTEDENTFSGRSITITISSISTTLKIQQVRIYWTVGRWSPQRDVTATNRFKDFYQYVRDLEDRASKPVV